MPDEAMLDRAGPAPAGGRRLLLQARLYGPATRRLLGDAGIGEGMRVLDVGSGTGDVALMLAGMVGPSGRVMGVERNRERAEFARRRAALAGVANLEIETGDAELAEMGEGYDAVVGRFVLRDLTDASEAVRRLAGLLRPGGVLAFQEKLLSVPVRSVPANPSLDRVVAWLDATRRRAGVELDMGAKLPHIYTEAGLPEPELRAELPAGVGADWAALDYVAETLRELLPLVRYYAVADGQPIEHDRIAAQLRRDAPAHAVVFLSPCVGAYVNVPTSGR